MNVIAEVNKVVLPFAIILISIVIVQAILFLHNALMFNKKHQMFSKEEIQDAMKSSIIGTIGPSFSVIVVVLAMISVLGPAVTWMRSGVIGSADFELWMADIVATALGVDLGSSNMTAAFFSVAIFGMVLGSAPFMLNLLITCKPLDKATVKSASKKHSFIPMLGFSAELGMMAYWALENGTKGAPQTAGIITSLVAGAAAVTFCQKGKHHKLSNWVLGFAMLVGMVCATAVAHLLA